MTEEQINEVMRLADEIADYAWKEGVSDGAYSNAKQDRECRAESRTELEAYLRTIDEPESVNAELLEALLNVARMAEALKQPCGTDPESRQAIRNGKYMSISYAARAAIARAESAMPFWPDHSSAISDPLFHQARGIMGTENFGQEEGLRLAILHVLNARAESIETPAKVSPAQAAPASPLKPHVFRELVNDLRDLAKQFHGHDSLRDRISGRLAQDVPVVGPCGGHTVQLPDPLGLLSCTHPDCGRYEGPRSHECRAMADNACARPSICQGHAVQQETDETRACETCGGRGEVGGFVGGGAPGYETHPCPDCRDDEVGGA